MQTQVEVIYSFSIQYDLYGNIQEQWGTSCAEGHACNLQNKIFRTWQIPVLVGWWGVGGDYPLILCWILDWHIADSSNFLPFAFFCADVANTCCAKYPLHGTSRN
jgi:hypothetical protein